MESIDRFIAVRTQKGLYRSLNPITSRKNGKIIIDSREYTDFSSNDYLGLAGHSYILEKTQTALKDFTAGSSGSRLMGGDWEIHHELEEKTAEFKNKESALIFNSGYQLNVGFFKTLLSKQDAVFSDKLCHASILDGIKLSDAAHFRFKHNDMEHLEALLKKHRGSHKDCCLVTESIFSMDGDRAPLKDSVELKNKYNCRLLLDEAHATGVFGTNGSGMAEELGLTGEIDYLMGTFSKALGGFGAYLAASSRLKDFFINKCTSFIYSTSLPPHVIAGNLAAMDLVKNEPARRMQLLERAEMFRNSLTNKGFMIRGDSQIVPVVLGDVENAGTLSEKLKQKGYWVMPVRPPTVPEGEARLRFSLNYHHTEETLKNLAEEIARASQTE
ncbi:MAG: 8-amino-7-oxononanoate synthase [bacterium]